MIDIIKKYLLQYPLFEKIENDIGIDYQSEQPDSFSINSVPENRLIAEDILGNRSMQFSFYLTSRAYTATDLDRIQNLNLLDNFSDWIYEQSKNGNLPELKENQIATSIEVTSNAYLYNNNPDIQNGVYQVQLKLYYIEKIKEE